jgi:hypothetical protein
MPLKVAQHMWATVAAKNICFKKLDRFAAGKKFRLEGNAPIYLQSSIFLQPQSLYFPNAFLSLLCKVARWYIFKPKIQIWVIFGGLCNERCWYILWIFDLFYSHSVHFMDIWCILW